MFTDYQNDTHIVSKKYIVEKKNGNTDPEASYFVIKSGDQAFTKCLLEYGRLMIEIGKPELAAGVIHLARYGNYDSFKHIGLELKYRIFDEETGEELDAEKYFVFRIDTDRYALSALEEYSNTLLDIKPKLAKDVLSLTENRSWHAFGIKY